MNPDEAVIGACLWGSPVTIDEALKYIVPADLFKWEHEQAFDAMIEMRNAGREIDPLTVANELARREVRGLDYAELFRLMQEVPSPSTIGYYSEIAAEASLRRRMARTLQSSLQAIYEKSQAPTTVLGDAITGLTEIRDNAPYSSVGGSHLGEVMAVQDHYDWVVRGLFERGDRYMVTGDEGSGKSMLMTQMSICMAAGLHPFYLYDIDPVRVLVMDFENTERQWRRKARKMFIAATRVGKGDPGQNLYLDANPAGTDLMSVKGLGYIHKVLDQYPADVLFIGPLYKLVPRAINTDDDAAPLLKAMDSLRERGCVLITEAHAGHQRQGNLHPVGSSAFMRWPEFGHGLRKDIADENRVTLERWRGDRDARSFPVALSRGTGNLAWVADDMSPGALARFNTDGEGQGLEF